jgi:mono/diheme cytochrome c family protein
VRTRTKLLGLLVLAAVAVSLATFVRTLRYGFSARDEPSRLEILVAHAMRRWSVPSDVAGRQNPVPLTPAVLAEARAHFADHCAYCHGNDGKGRTQVGQNLYPRAPDMTLAETQAQSDGALFATIENGIRLTGMPAWGSGTAESAQASWTLVHFIRHLPRITPEEIAEMESLNPKPPAERAATKEEEEFLAGADETTPPAASPTPSPRGQPR